MTEHFINEPGEYDPGIVKPGDSLYFKGGVTFPGIYVPAGEMGNKINVGSFDGLAKTNVFTAGSYMTVHDMIIDGKGRNYGMEVPPGEVHELSVLKVAWENCANGLALNEGGSDLLIRWCHLKNMQNSGFSINGSGFTNSYFLDNIINGPEKVQGNDGISIHDLGENNYPGKHHVIARNVISGFLREDGIDITAGEDIFALNNHLFNNRLGIYAGMNSKNVYAGGNKIDVGQFGILIDAQNVVAYNNKIKGKAGANSLIAIEDGYGNDIVAKIWNNNLIKNGAGAAIKVSQNRGHVKHITYGRNILKENDDIFQFANVGDAEVQEFENRNNVDMDDDFVPVTPIISGSPTFTVGIFPFILDDDDDVQLEDALKFDHNNVKRVIPVYLGALNCSGGEPIEPPIDPPIDPDPDEPTYLEKVEMFQKKLFQASRAFCDILREFSPEE